MGNHLAFHHNIGFVIKYIMFNVSFMIYYYISFLFINQPALLTSRNFKTQRSELKKFHDEVDEQESPKAL